MAQQTGGTQFSRRLHAVLSAMAFALPIVIVGMLVAWLYIASRYGNSRPDNWFRLALFAEMIETSLLPLMGICLLAGLTRRFAARGHAWPLVVPVLLLLLIVLECGVYLRGLERVRACEAVIILCFIPDVEAGPGQRFRAMS